MICVLFGWNRKWQLIEMYNIFIWQSMIKKVTPSKNFNKERRQDSCCGFCPAPKEHGQIVFLEDRRSTKISRAHTPSRLELKRKAETPCPSVESQSSLNTPGTSLLPSQVHSRNKTLLHTAATIDLTTPLDQFSDHAQLAPPEDFLSALKQRLFRGSSEREHVNANVLRGRVSFNYLPGKRQECLAETASVEVLEGVRVEQPQAADSAMRRQIESLRVEYLRLVEEEDALRGQRESNAAHYSRLLERLRQKEAELRELQRLRSQEVAELRAELQQYIASHAQQ